MKKTLALVELNIGLSDEVPDLKAAVGYTFRREQ